MTADKASLKKSESRFYQNNKLSSSLRLQSARTHPQISMGGNEEKYKGIIDRNTVRKIMNSRIYQFESCYSHHGLGHADQKIIVKFEIDIKGHPSSISFSKTTEGDKFKDCFERIIRSMQFPSPESELATIEYPFYFLDKTSKEYKATDQ
jgi:hypothetical protein